MNISLKEKTYGAIFGYAIGDALGLGTEFMTRREIRRKYPEGLTNYSQIIRDAHRSQWNKGEYTNDTLIVGMLIDSLCDSEGADYMDFARRLREWYLTEPIDLTSNLRWVISQKDFADNPIVVSERVWRSMQIDEAPSDAIGRALITGMWDEDVEQNSDDFCRVTHPNSRCRVSSKVIGVMANSLMWRDKEADFDTLVTIANNEEPEVVRYLDIARSGMISDFTLDDPDSYWYARKAMGAALWCLWHCETPDEALLCTVNQGGDADTNASLAVGLMGLKHGFSALGKNYVDGLVLRPELDRLAEKFTSTLEKRFTK